MVSWIPGMSSVKKAGGGLIYGPGTGTSDSMPAWLSADEVQPVHEFAGDTISGLVAFRLVWGVVGSRHARFAQFVKGPRATLAYLGTLLRGSERR